MLRTSAPLIGALGVSRGQLEHIVTPMGCSIQFDWTGLLSIREETEGTRSEPMRCSSHAGSLFHYKHTRARRRMRRTERHPVFRASLTRSILAPNAVDPMEHNPESIGASRPI